MNPKDKLLGLDRAISRRDFLNGVSVAIGASLLPGCSKTDESLTTLPSEYYPPALTGMRGSHPGSFEVAHATVQGQQWSAEKTGEHYDLVVVGAGISGLASAYIYQRDVNPDARILILDNHDDFGGHAKRNEFELDGRTFIGYGGTMMMDSVNRWPSAAKRVIDELGLDLQRHSDSYHKNLFESHGAGRVSFFDKETFGADYLADGELGIIGSIDETPLSPPAKKELERLFDDETNYLEDLTIAERRRILRSHSWAEYLREYAGMGEEVVTFIQKWPHGVWAIGADALPAYMAWSEDYPGFGDMDLGESFDEVGVEDARDFYFPDGNASIARLLVRRLIPAVAPGDSLESIVRARFDYGRLDLPDNHTRIRLNSTVVNLQHADGSLDADVEVTYVADGAARTVSASNVVWAGYHAMLPYICPDLPDEQSAALASAERAPLSYTNVLIRNWQSLAKLNIQRAYCPGSFFQTLLITHPVSMGGYEFSTTPDEPVVLHLQHIPLAPGLPAAEQFRAGRRALLEMPFETFERNLREQLGRMLGPGGFDPARDIAGITVNRWPHGYAYSVEAESGDVAWWPERWQHETRPWIVARQPIGRIVFAGTDSASNAMTEAAIEEAQRAVDSLRSDGAG